MSAAGRPPSDPERDAWLREALRHAPDASASPPPSISDTILAQARAATRAGVASRAAPSTSLLDRALAFWSWLARPQVAAGFASVMAATLVGMLWWDRPIDEAMLPAPVATPPMATAPMATAPEAAKEAPLADVARPPASDPAKVAAPTDDRLREAPLPRQRQEQRQAEVARERADKQVQAEAAKLKQKDDRAQQTAPSAQMRAPVTAAAAPATTDRARSGADAPTPFPARSPTEAEASSRSDAPSVAARREAAPAAARPAAPPAAAGLAGPMAAAPPPAAAPAPPAAAPAPPAAAPAPPTAAPAPPPPAQPAPTTPRAEPFALAKKAESSDKDNVEAKTRPAAPAGRAPAPTGSLGGAALDSAEPGAGGRATAQNAADAAVRQATAPAVTATRPMASLLAALALDDARWSRRLAGGESAAIDASLRNWLAEVQAAAPQWERTAARSARRDAQAETAAPATLATLRLDRDGRPGAIVQIEERGVRFEPLAGSAWFAPLPPAVAARLRATLPPAPR